MHRDPFILFFKPRKDDLLPPHFAKLIKAFSLENKQYNFKYHCEKIPIRIKLFKSVLLTLLSASNVANK